MHYTLDGSALTLDGYIAEYISGILYFQVTGTHFPYSNYEPPNGNTAAYNGTLFEFRSSTPNKAKINYGDGTALEYTFVLNSGSYLLRFMPSIPLGNSVTQPVHSYTDGNSGIRVVSFEFAYPESITMLTSTYSKITGLFPNDIAELPALSYISLNGCTLTQFPVTLSSLSMLRTLELANIGTAITQRIPNEFLSLSLQTLSVSLSVNLSNPETSNFTNLCNSNLQYTLALLRIDGCRVNTVPNAFSNLQALKTLYIGAGLDGGFTTMPTQLNTLPNLELLNIGTYQSVNNSIQFWSSVSNLTGLKNLQCYFAVNMETGLPPNLANCTLLKSYNVSGTYQNTTRINAFIDNMYAFIVANAAMTGSPSLPFRGMTISTHTVSFPGGVATGTYQQPAGYVAGSNNGTPASQKEKVWVMVNQYGHMWINNF